MSAQEAREEAKELTDAFFDALEKIDLLPRVGELNADGDLITEEDVASHRQMIEDAGMETLREAYTICGE